MPINSELTIRIFLTILVGFIISFAATPIVKSFAEKVGAIDMPGEARRVHNRPIPRMGGLAIFLGFLLSVLLFVPMSRPLEGVLLGSVIIVATGAVDDVVSLKAWVKLLLQIAAACVAVYYGVRIEVLGNLNIFSSNDYVTLASWSVPITVLWIVGITNSVNLIDGLDGLAVGVSTISSLTMLVIALLVADSSVAVVLAIAVPLFDTIFAFFRRLIHGQNPMHPDRGHFHHRLIDMGLSQKQAVAVLYTISAILGLAAVVITTSGELKALILILGFCLCAFVWAAVYGKLHHLNIGAAIAGETPTIEPEPEKKADDDKPDAGDDTEEK